MSESLGRQKPKVTRLRFARASDPEMFAPWLSLLGQRIQIYGAPQFDGEAWFLWFVPGDFSADIPNVNLDEV